MIGAKRRRKSPVLKSKRKLRWVLVLRSCETGGLAVQDEKGLKAQVTDSIRDSDETLKARTLINKPSPKLGKSVEPHVLFRIFVAMLV